ncbi:MAG: DMT family transporter [Gemmatimonadales bacterium]
MAPSEAHNLSEKRRGIVYALAAAVMFGTATPFAKYLLGETSPQAMAGLLYLSSGAGLAIVRALRPGRSTNSLGRKDLPWITGAVFAGGVTAPFLLMNGLQRTPASVASLLLNLEAVFTAVIAWLLFGEKFASRVALGLVAVMAGGILLGWQGRAQWSDSWGPALVAGACLAWSLDNNLMEKISRSDPIQIGMIKGLAAGAINTLLALTLHAVWPSAAKMVLAGLLGFVGYGVSLVLFVMALRIIGTTRTIVSFSVAPFVGATIGVLIFHEPVTWILLASGFLMAVGVSITATAPRTKSVT